MLFVLLSTIHCTLYPAFATTDLGQSRITPASPFYFLKVVRENWELRFAKTSQAKMLLQLELATTRLKEAKSLLSENQDLIQPTLERYMSNLNSLPDKHNEKDELGIKIKEALNIHLAALEQMYPLASNLKAKMAIRSVMNRVIQRADVAPVAKLPICTLFFQEASSSALSQTERMMLAERANKCITGSNRAGF